MITSIHVRLSMITVMTRQHEESHDGPIYFDCCHDDDDYSIMGRNGAWGGGGGGGGGRGRGRGRGRGAGINEDSNDDEHDDSGPVCHGDVHHASFSEHCSSCC